MLLIAVVVMLLVGLAVGVAALVGVGRVVRTASLASAEDWRAHRRRRLAVVLVASSLVGLAVWMSEFIRDPVVVTDGERTHCVSGIGEDMPSRVVEQCDAQSHDRHMQALVAGVTAAGASAVVLWVASGRRRQSRMNANVCEASHVT